MKIKKKKISDKDILLKALRTLRSIKEENNFRKNKRKGNFKD